MGKTGVLHTSSAWGLEEVNLTFERRSVKSSNAAILNLKNAEQRLYDEFGQSDYVHFRDLLRSCFSEEIIGVMSRFKPEYLSKRLQDFYNGYEKIYKQQVQIEFNIENIQKKYDIKKNLPKGELKITGDNGAVIGTLKNLDGVFVYTGSFDKSLKQALNAIIKGHNFKTTSDLLNNVERMVQILLKGPNPGIIITSGESGDKHFEGKFELSPIPNFPWGLNMDVYKQAVKNNDEDMLEEIQRAIDRIRNFIIFELGSGAPTELSDAITDTLDGKEFSSKARDKNNLALFFKGGTKANFASGVQGALGELQTGIIFNFLKRKFPNANSVHVTILGNKFKKGTSEKLKTDVEILKGLGIQVKNFNEIQNEAQETKLIRDIETNIHPDELAKQLSQGRDFLDYIANYCFNTTFKEKTDSTYNEMIDMLNDYLGEVMNMSMHKGIKDKISFYMISSNYLVPASKILEIADSVLKMRDNIEITSSFSDLTDDQWKAYYYSAGKTVMYNGKKVQMLSPNYIEYWTKDRSSADGWKATPKNKSMFKELVGNRISIRTRFNIWNEIQQYALF